ncbi:MAG: winged helix-turn-helix transcriptional regulator [Pseudomonadota bacterium]
MPDMRFAPAPVLLEQKLSGGLNQTSVRGHNERLILDLLRREGTLSRLEIGKHTGLSAQTISVLVRALLKDGLLLEGETSKGRVGPPTTPFSLNPDGAFALGIYAGVRVIDACLLDFQGTLRETHRRHLQKDADVATQVEELATQLLLGTSAGRRGRCLGIGLGVNKAHWSAAAGGDDRGWHPASGMDKVEDQMTNSTSLPCYILEDTTSAATGHVLYGDRATGSSFLYCHVGAQTRIRVVLGGQAQVGHNEALATLPGLAALEERLTAAGHSGVDVWMGNSIPVEAHETFQNWAQDLAKQVTSVSRGLLAFLDVPRFVLVTSLAEQDAHEVAEAVSSAHQSQALDVHAFTGHNAQWAKASGAAACVLSDRFTPGWNEGSAA